MSGSLLEIGNEIGIRVIDFLALVRWPRSNLKA